jgi:signal transduction histidine kinase
LQNLINDILDLATIEAGGMEIGCQRLVVSELLESVVHLMAEQGRQHLVTIELACGVPADEAIEGDERRLRQSLVNLVSNAIKYTLAGGIITLGADRDAAGINIWVADTGIGIDPRLHETVFEIFETAGERRRGAGLGLSLVRRLVALHGGEVRIESEMGAGTRVVCSLPLPALDPDLRLDLLSH